MKTYATHANAVKAIEKAGLQSASYVVVSLENGRFAPLFFGRDWTAFHAGFAVTDGVCPLGLDHRSDFYDHHPKEAV